MSLQQGESASDCYCLQVTRGASSSSKVVNIGNLVLQWKRSAAYAAQGGLGRETAQQFPRQTMSYQSYRPLLLLVSRSSSASDFPAVETELTFPSMTVVNVPFSIKTGANAVPCLFYKPTRSQHSAVLLSLSKFPNFVHQMAHRCRVASPHR